MARDLLSHRAWSSTAATRAAASPPPWYTSRLRRRVESRMGAGAVKLDEGSVPSHALPPFERHVLYAAHADPAIDRNPLRLHVVVIRRMEVAARNRLV